MSREESESNNKGKNGDNLNLKKEDFSKEFKYSIAVGFTSFVIILGIANFVSTRYLSISMKLGLTFLFSMLLMATIGVLITILMEGILLTEPLKKFSKGAKSISDAFFDWGLCSAFLAVICYLPTFLFTVLVLSRLNSSFLQIISLSIFLLLLFFLILRVFDANLKSLTLKSFFNFTTLIIIFIISSSFIGSIYICQNSCTISIEVSEKYSNTQDQKICVPVVKVLGFASINNPEQQILWVRSTYRWEQQKLLDIHEIEKGLYYSYLDLSDLDEGLYFAYFGVTWFKIMGWEKYSEKTEILIVDKTEE